MSRKPKTKGRKKPAQPLPSTPGIKILPRLLSGLAITATIIALLSRIFLSANPMTRDEGTYGYLGKLAMKGYLPYLEFYEMKPPVLFYLYGLGGSLFGFTDFGLRFFALLLNATSCLLIYLILQRYIDKVFALVAVAVFAMLSNNPFAFGFSMVAEHIVNTLVLLSLFLIHKSYEQASIKQILAGGTVFSLAILTKQAAIVFSPVILLYFILERNKIPWVKQTIRFAIGALIPVVVLFLFFLITGALDEAIYWLIKYPSQYTSTIGISKGISLFFFFFKNIAGFQVMLFSLAALGILGNIIFLKTRSNQWLLAYFFLAAVSLVPGFRFYGQYWLLLFPPMAMMTGTALQRLSKINIRYGMLAGFVVLLCISLEFIMHKDYYFFKEHSMTIEQLYHKNPFEPIRKLSKYAGSLMKEEDSFMVLGSEPQAYLYTNKIAPTKHIFMSMISNQDNKSILLMDQALNDLKTKNPTYVLFNLFSFSWGLTEGSNDKLYQSSFSHVRRQYVPVAAYNMTTRSYIYPTSGIEIDPSVANQVILFKRI